MDRLTGSKRKRSKNKCNFERNKYKRVISEKSTGLAQACLGCTELDIEEPEEHSP